MTFGSMLQEGEDSISVRSVRADSPQDSMTGGVRDQSSLGEGSRTTLMVLRIRRNALSALDIFRRIQDMAAKLRADCER